MIAGYPTVSVCLVTPLVPGDTPCTYFNNFINADIIHVFRTKMKINFNLMTYKTLPISVTFILTSAFSVSIIALVKLVQFASFFEFS